MKNIRLSALIFSFLLTFQVIAQGEGDKIIAIVGNEVVLQSDLNFQLYTYMNQNNIQEVSNEMVQQVFQGIISEKLMLAKAEQDSIFISVDEVNKQVEGRIREMVLQFGSEKNVEDAYGLTIPKIKSLLKEQTERNIKVSRVRQARFGYAINVTKPEVLKFFNEYKDSLPQVPETYELLQIVRIPKITEDAKFIAKEKAEKILDSVRSGMDFSELAKKYSDDSLSAIQGGSLGKSKKGSFVKEFEEAAFLLKAGEVSGIVETEFGYHIIKLNDKSGDFITAQHILVKFPRLDAADFTEINFLKELRNNIKSGQVSFKEAVILYSQEPKSAIDSGYIGKVSVNNFEPLELAALKDVSVGDISDPVKVGDNKYYGYYIYLVKDKIPQHAATIETDYILIQQYAQKYKEQKLMGEWLEELKKTIYLEIKL